MATFNDLEKESLQLSAQERARLALNLIQSLDDEDNHSTSYSEQLLIAEVKQRSEELKQGKVKGIPAKKVFKDARSRIK